ncbi:M20/M25/M40 family metallo-hydrolase [Gracilibacillus sp. S3-1-1]|uniref:M20/M25/M40 family metallo-hydrolase n=1 Tax=Gracilibacillus pellucidus TaxID=3095368 RepID=A0ACC6M1H0_9BACI|nr:M20/M25/M40 family metallo-hydrolase [Gracilibacillus sp. S3-1-1]MDX8044786.1 M20/M25/M40 family metallo-hydrolase [Gracilibacillus sp. S3-1-1]
MEKERIDFLQELLHTPSPSSMEMEIQKKWIKYVEPFADEIRTDNAGNVIAVKNEQADFHLLLAGHSDEIAFVVNRIDERGYVYVDKMGGINPKAAIGMKVEILGQDKKVPGVIGVNAQHHGGIKGDFDVADLFIDCGSKDKAETEVDIQIGDLVVYRRQSEVLKDRYVSGRGLDNRTGAFIVAEVMRKLAEQDINIGVYGVSTVNEETNMGGAYFAAAGLEPDAALALDVTFATDYPSVDTGKYGDIRLDGGPVLAKGAPINRKLNQLLEKNAKQLDMDVQYELTPRLTGTDADKMRLTGKGVPISLVSLPLRYMHSPVETASIKDIEEEITLLVEMITNMTGKESLNPLED